MPHRLVAAETPLTLPHADTTHTPPQPQAHNTYGTAVLALKTCTITSEYSILSKSTRTL